MNFSDSKFYTSQYNFDKISQIRNNKKGKLKNKICGVVKAFFRKLVSDKTEI